MNNLTAPTTTSTPIAPNTGRAYELLRQGVDLYMGRTLGDDCSETLRQMRLDQSGQATRFDVLDTTLRLRHDLLADAPPCSDLETAELSMVVREFICDCYGTPRDIKQVIRVGRRGTPYQHGQFLTQPTRWLPIVVMTTAAVLMHTNNPYLAIATLRATDG